MSSIAGPGEISTVDAARLAAAGEAVLLDVREDFEWAVGHAAEAIHVPLGALRLDNVPQGRPLIAVCRSGNRSAMVTEALCGAGLEARNMTGGMLAWVRAGLPVLADDGGPGAIA